MFKSFVASALLAVTAFTSPVAKAYTATQVQLMEALTQAGVEYSKGECRPHGLTGSMGFYHPEKKWIHICDDVTTSDFEVWETMRHESVHVAQHCRDASMNNTLATEKWLVENGSANDWAHIRANYKQADWMIELEAFTLMRESNETIAELVDLACNN